MIQYLEHHIVDHCNLNCAGCTHFSPLVEEPWYEDIRIFEQDFTKLAEMTDVRLIRLMGGEPLLHPQLCEFLQIVRNLFPNSEIQLVTNGILLKQRRDELLPLCNNLKIKICTSNYHLNFSIDEYLKGFKYTRIDDKAQMYNASIHPQYKVDAWPMFDRCDLHTNHFYYFQNGRFYPCCISANIHYFQNYFDYQNINCNDINKISISIYDHSIEEVKQFLNQPIPLCSYCNTIARDRSYNPFHISKKDIKEWTYQ